MAGDPLSAYLHRSTLVDPSGVQSEGVNKTATYVWDTVGLAWVKATSTGGGGGGGAVTIADGADVAEGSTSDAAWGGSGAGSVVSLLKKLATATPITGSVSAVAYAKRYDQVDSLNAYLGNSAVGSATSAAVWAIQKLVFTSGGSVTITWADGDSLFNNIWDNRASLTYS